MNAREASGNRLPALVTILAVLAGSGEAVVAQQDDRVETVVVREDAVYLLAGRGGNIGLSVGEDGAFLIDDKYAPMTDEIRAAVAAVSDANVAFVLNTHWHGDHTGGNERFGEAGAMIVAHENVRRRMNPEAFQDLVGSSEQHPPSALPVITFNDAVTFYWNGDEIRALHVGHAHTDGDALIHLPRNDVIHTGDLYFNGTYPFIDVESGGSIHGMIDGARRALELAGPETKIIPGHGPLSGLERLRTYLAMLETVRDRVGALIEEGSSEDEVVETNPTSDFDDDWGGGFISPERFVRLVYRGMVEGRR